MSAASERIRNALNGILRRRPPFVLCYHGVGEPSEEDRHGLFVSRPQFEAHLDVIASQGYELVTVSQLWDRLSKGRSGRGLGAVSFDDALAQTAEEAIPELARRGMPSTMYVATGLLDTPHPNMRGERVMSADEVRELARAGVEIGAHSVDHLPLPTLSYAAAFDQVKRSRDDLEALLDRPVLSMAYPFGAHDADTIRAARAAGYETACACSGPGRWSPFSLPREPIFPSVTPLRLSLKLAGLYGPAHRLALARARLRRSAAQA